EHLDADCSTHRKIAVLLETQPAQPGELNGVRENDNGAGQAEAAQPLLLRLALWVAELAALQLAFPLERAAAEAVGKGSIQIAQRLLRRTFGHLVHPGKFGLLERVQFAVEINR